MYIDDFCCGLISAEIKTDGSVNWNWRNSHSYESMGGVGGARRICKDGNCPLRHKTRLIEKFLQRITNNDLYSFHYLLCYMISEVIVSVTFFLIPLRPQVPLWIGSFASPPGSYRPVSD